MEGKMEQNYAPPETKLAALVHQHHCLDPRRPSKFEGEGKGCGKGWIGREKDGEGREQGEEGQEERGGQDEREGEAHAFEFYQLES